MTKFHITMLLFCFPALTAGLYGQQPVQQNLYFVKKNQAVTFGKFDYLPDKTNAFYIYRNCIYNITLQNKIGLSIKVTDIHNDSIYFIEHYNQYAAVKLFSNRTDTLRLHPSEIAKIRLIEDAPFSALAGYSLKKCTWVFERATEPKAFKHSFYTYSTTDCNPQPVYELIPCLRQHRLDVVYEKNCDRPIYEDTAGSAYAFNLTRNRYFQLRKWVWFTPSNANEIRGLNIGLQTMKANDDSLTIKGMNLNMDLVSMNVSILSMFFLGKDNKLIDIPDTVRKSNGIKVKGLSVSGGGLVGEIQAKGLSLNGGVCMTEETTGLVISGLHNYIEEFKGVVIGSVRNKSIKGSGVQIGLWNICKHMKGVQLGIWNVNSKRKLPLINWDF